MDYQRELATRRLEQAAIRAGFPAEFGLALADFLGGPKTMARMADYLVSARPQTVEEAADEAVALVEERSTWVERQRSEQAQAAYTAFVNRPREEDFGCKHDYTDEGNEEGEDGPAGANECADEGDAYERRGVSEFFNDPGDEEIPW